MKSFYKVSALALLAGCSSGPQGMEEGPWGGMQPISTQVLLPVASSCDAQVEQMWQRMGADQRTQKQWGLAIGQASQACDSMKEAVQALKKAAQAHQQYTQAIAVAGAVLLRTQGLLALRRPLKHSRLSLVLTPMRAVLWKARLWQPHRKMRKCCRSKA